MSAQEARHRRILGVIAAAAVLLRLAFSLGYWQDKPLTQDEQEYLSLGMNLAAPRAFVPELPGAPPRRPGEHFSRAPLYPLTLSWIVRATGLSTDVIPPAVPAAVQIVQSLAGAIVVLAIAGLARQAGGMHAGCWAAAIAAVYPPLVWISGYALTEALFAPCVLVALWLLATATGAQRVVEAAPPSLSRVALAGVVLGLSALIRSSALALLPFLAVWLARRHRRAAMTLVVAALATISPWTARNYGVHGRLIPVAADGGVNLWIGNHPAAIGEGDFAANPNIKKQHVALLDRHPQLGPEALEPIYYQEAIAFIAGDAGRQVRLVARKLYYTFVPLGPSYWLHSPLYAWTSLLAYSGLFGLAVLGWVRRGSAGWPPWPLTAAAVATVVTNLVFFPQERYRIPILDPTYVVSAALWLSAWRFPLLPPDNGTLQPRGVTSF